MSFRSRLYVRALEPRNAPAVFTVMNVNDSGAGSLRQALLDANALAGADSIAFDAAAFATAKTIAITSGQINIADAVTITGPTAKVTLDAGKLSRLLNIDVPAQTGQDVKISGLILTNGNVSGGFGAGILNNDEALTLSDAVISNCTSDKGGGGLSLSSSSAALTMTDCALNGNTALGATSSGGAISISSASTVNISRSSFFANSAGRGGGAYYCSSASAKVIIGDSSFWGNASNVSSSTDGGGAISCSGYTTLRNCTISGNSAYVGGGVYCRSGGPIAIQNCTIAFNTASFAGGGVSGYYGSVTVTSTIIAKNNSLNAPDYDGSPTVNYSLLGSISGTTITGGNNKLGVDPLLSPLANNGGPTQTHLIQNGSPAIDTGSNPSSIGFDQRGLGFARVSQGVADIGAFEIQGNIPTAAALPTTILVSSATTHIVTVVYSDDVAVNVGSLGTGDISISGPNGFAAIPSFVSVDVNINGKPRTATYSFAPPGGDWTFTDNGTYEVAVTASEVFDSNTPSPNSVLPGIIGTFVANMAGNYFVDLAIDENDGNYSAGDLSLREALSLTNASVAQTDTISFSTSTFATPQTIALSLGQVVISDPLVINGPTAKLTIDGSGKGRIFYVDVPSKTGQPMFFSNLTFTGATSGAVDGVNEALTFTNCQFIGNQTPYSGGAVSIAGFPASSSSLTMVDCSLIGNSATTGAAVYCTGNVSLTRCAFLSNSAGSSGGAIYISNSASVVTITNCTIGNNQAIAPTAIYGNASSAGGGVWVSCKTATIQNSTIAGNSSVRGGGIYWLAGTLSVSNSTIAFNSATTGGGMFLAYGATSLESCIVAKNFASVVDNNVGGRLAANYSLFGDIPYAIVSGTGNLINADPKLVVLGDNGGPTLTLALAANSPAIDKGSNSVGLTTDQRGTGFPRIVGVAPDIGALEGMSTRPTAMPVALMSPVAESSLQTVAIEYGDDTAIDVGSLNIGDIMVTGPNGFVAAPTLTTVNSTMGGKLVTAIYSFVPPGGSWDPADSGKYIVTINAGEVFDFGSPAPQSVTSATISVIDVALPVNYVVDLAFDEDDGNYSTGDLSLREAINLANLNLVANVITFNPVVFSAPTTLVLSLGEMKIQAPMTVLGPSARLTLDAQDKSRFFDVNVTSKSQQPVRFDRLTMTRGNNFHGGAIRGNDENLILTNCVFQSNSSGWGGVVLLQYSLASLTVSDCEFYANTATAYGGIIAIYQSAAVRIHRTIASGNSAGSLGGVIDCDGAYGSLTITDSLMNGNSVFQPGASGGAINAWQTTMFISNCTISGNSAKSVGGGIDIEESPTCTIANSTIVANSAAQVGGLRGGLGQAFLHSTIVADNIAASYPDIFPSVFAENSLVENPGGVLVTGANNIVNVDPMLAPLANYGGPTQTHRLLPGSPAINAGSNPAGLTTDQRGPGFKRSVGQTDIGAYEVQAAPKVLAIQINDGSPQRSRITSLTVTFDSPVNLPANPTTAFELKRLSDSAIVTTSASLAGNAVTLTFTGGLFESGSLPDGRYMLTALSSQIGNADVQLDGDGNGVGGDDFVLLGTPANGLFRLFGDTDGDGGVAASDFIQFRLALGGNSVIFDFDNDGAVAAGDFIQFRLRFGGSI